MHKSYFVRGLNLHSLGQMHPHCSELSHYNWMSPLQNSLLLQVFFQKSTYTISYDVET